MSNSSKKKDRQDPTPTVFQAPDYESIAKLAYSFWEERGCQDGFQEEDWLRAEAELSQPQHADSASA